MKIEYDPNKNRRNITKHGISFDLAERFEWDTALIWEDTRYNYGETRFCALGYIEIRMYHLVFTYRDDTVRVISLRKANKREIKHYAET
ncbi:MAG: BrnT family toxin [Candidatus Electrothrix communis]|nr:MAG: BrnT family toxin [Candidatus Electrothrix communis]